MSSNIIPAHASNYTQGRVKKKIQYIVIHYTGNNGDTARNNGLYFSRPDRQASAHFFVDEVGWIQSVAVSDTAWHAGNWDMNLKSLGVEMCSCKDKKGVFYIPKATIDNTVKLVKDLMKQFNIPIDNVIRHYDVTGKRCPEPFVRDPAQWDAFKKELLKEDKVDMSKNEPSAWAKEACDWAIKMGFFKGDDNGNYHWHDGITREELALVLYRWYNTN